LQQRGLGKILADEKLFDYKVPGAAQNPPGTWLLGRFRLQNPVIDPGNERTCYVTLRAVKVHCYALLTL